MKLKGKKIVIGITGCIAAYKMCEVVSALTKMGAICDVIMTKHATEFVSPLTFETLSGRRVIADMFDREFEWEVEHVSLAKGADLMLVAPATGDIIGKFASGIADDMLSTTFMATHAPVLVAPAMNTGMYTSASVQANLATLRERGVYIMEAGEGRLACGDVGVGRLPEPKDIIDTVVSMLLPTQDYAGVKVLVSAGATRESIDPVRFITNHSSGKMGRDIALRAIARGAEVRIVKGIVSVDMPDCDTIDVTTTIEMRDAILDEVEWADVIIMAAAPADYRVKEVSTTKIKSSSLTLEMVKNPDIARAVGEIKGDKTLVIFAAETNSLEDNAVSKLVSKNADMVVANDVTREGAGFNSDTNAVTIIKPDGSRISTEVLPKSQIADIILDEVINGR